MKTQNPPHSLLERLLDEDRPQDPPSRPWMDLTRVRQSLARDLETLLNTRTALPATASLETYPACRASMLTYGVPDTGAFSLRNPGDQERLREQLAGAITAHEPRLRQVKVRLDPDRSGHHALHFRVEGTLAAHPSEPSLAFDGTLQMTSGVCEVHA